MKDLYSTRVQVRGGRDGHARSEDGHLDLRMALPQALGGAGDATNPEQLFAAGFAGCFTSSVKHAARQQGLDAGAVATDAVVVIGVDDAGRFGLRATLRVVVPGVPPERMAAVIAEAKRICAYSNATRGNVEVTVES